MDFVADTTFLVGLWRRQAWALEYSREHANQSIGLPWVVLGEFWHGSIRAGHDPAIVDRFLQLGSPIEDVKPIIPVYAQFCANMQEARTYSHVGQNDLWIGATAICLKLPVLSRNQRHFGSMPELQVIVPA